MSNTHLFVLAVRCDDTTAEVMGQTLVALANGLKVGPIVRDWEPDADTVADAIPALAGDDGIDYDDLRIHDLNPTSSDSPV